VLGGFDFGVGVGRVNVPAGYRIISSLRFGFFGSPLRRILRQPHGRTRSRCCWITWRSPRLIH